MLNIHLVFVFHHVCVLIMFHYSMLTVQAHALHGLKLSIYIHCTRNPGIYIHLQCIFNTVCVGRSSEDGTVVDLTNDSGVEDAEVVNLTSPVSCT